MRTSPFVVMVVVLAGLGCSPSGTTGEGEGELSGEGEGEPSGEGEGEPTGEGEGEGEGEQRPLIEFPCGRQEVISLFQCGPDGLYTSGVYYTEMAAADGTCSVTINLDNGTDVTAVDAEAALAELDCKGDCVWRADIAAQFLYCGRRSEFIRYTDDRGICVDVYSYPPQGDETFSDAVVTDPEQWATDHPCPDEEGQ